MGAAEGGELADRVGARLGAGEGGVVGIGVEMVTEAVPPQDEADAQP